MNLKKSILPILTLIGSYSSMNAQDTPLLKGHIEATAPVQVTMLYDHEGDAIAKDTETDANGNFSFSEQLPGQTKEVFLYINAQPYGAFLENGKTVEMNITGEEVAFKGANIPENEYVNKYQQVFFSGNYKPSPDEKFDYAKSREKLQSNYNEVLKAIDGIRPDMQANAKDLASKFLDHYRILLMRLDPSDTDYTKEYEEIIASIDPNSDNTRLTGLLSDWYNSPAFPKEKSGETATLVDAFSQVFQNIDKALFNEANKKNLYNSIGTMFFMYHPEENDVNQFFAAVEPQIGNAPLLKEHFMEVYESMKDKINNGDPLPTDPVLIAPDGSTCHLSDLLGKNVVYIDIWATWCRPCCAEIPHLEKVVERFKGNDKVSFISISQDADKDKWLRKVEKDNPQWPQFIFEPKSGEEFLKAMTINAIPRFLIIGKDSKILSKDAERPSNPEIDNILNKASE